MKKKSVMIIAAALIMSLAGATAVMPVFADSGIKSRGDLILEGSNVKFYSADIENLQTQVDILAEELPKASYVSVADQKALRPELKSKGIIDFDSGKVVFDASDIVNLADRVVNLDVGYKYEAVDALFKLNTFFRWSDGVPTHDKTQGVYTASKASGLTFSQICEGIRKSQSVDHLADKDVLPASANNLSSGSAAWVDGKLLIGNGHDNEENYKKGYDDGYAKGYDDGYAKGREDGHTEGYEEGRADGHDEGYEDGHAKGYEEGYAKGREDGHTEGYEEGYAKGYEDGVASKSSVSCYYLGNTTVVSSYGMLYYDIGARVPEVDHTKLTYENFIVCPNKVKQSSSKITKQTSLSSCTPYCSIAEQELQVDKYYDPELGYLYISSRTISASGGLQSASGLSTTTSSYLDACVYLVVGDIEER